MSTAIKPNYSKISLSGGTFFHHTFTHLVLVVLTCTWEFGVSLNFEIVNAKKGIPMNANINPRFYPIFSTRFNKILNNVSLTISPFHSLKAIWIHITLIQSKSCFMGSRQYRDLCSHIFRWFHPLISIQFFWIKNIIIGNRCNSTLRLNVFLPIKNMKVMVKNCYQLSFLPSYYAGLGIGTSPIFWARTPVQHRIVKPRITAIFFIILHLKIENIAHSIVLTNNNGTRIVENIFSLSIGNK